MKPPELGALLTLAALIGWVGRGWVQVPPGAEQMALWKVIRDMRRVWRRRKS